MSAETTPAPPPVTAAQGDLLSPDQIKLLRRAVWIMSTLLVLGLSVLIGRIIYLASGRSPQGTLSEGIATGAGMATESVLALPLNAQTRQVSLSGDRLAVHYSAPNAEGVVILDLRSGLVISRVQFNRPIAP
jgi:hypothetical protein